VKAVAIDAQSLRHLGYWVSSFDDLPDGFVFEFG
jgi:hypothetical protein